MKRFIFVSFLFMGWAFYELSGGADFVPEERAAAEPAPETVTRADTSALENLTRPTLASLPIVADTLATPVADPVVEPSTPPVVAVAEPELVAAPEPVAEPGLAAEPAPELAAIDLRAVASTRVNMREGPGTDFGVVTTVDEGTLAEVIEVTADGWARVRLIDSDLTGWMAARLLTDG